MTWAVDRGTAEGHPAVNDDVGGQRANPIFLDREMMALNLVANGLQHCAIAFMVVQPQQNGRFPIVYANDAFLRLTGYALEDVLGRRYDLLRGPETSVEVAAALDAAFTEDRLCDVDVLHYRRDGSPFWNGVTISPLRDGSGETGSYMVMMRDVTSRRRADDRLAALADRLHDLAMSDPLTGVANRRNFDSTLQREWRRAVRTGGATALAMIDIDHFKSFNDQFGHPAGDRCLRSVATTLTGVARRPTDFVARYGGEEFVVLMSDIDAAGAARIGQALVDAVRGTAISHPRQDAGCITISCGVAAVVPATYDGSAEDFVAQADRALYLAKAGGRNRMHQVTSRA